MSKVFDFIEAERIRQTNAIELIASENFVSDNVLKAVGSILTNKYTEGYPADHKSGNKGRYYGGCEFYDRLEQYCADTWCKVFQTDYHCNVQPHSGSQANMAAYLSVLKPGDTILAMSLDNGGHLTHGSPVNFSGKLFKMVFYNVDSNGRIDYDDLKTKLCEYKPKLVLAGASAYSRAIDFARIKDIINKIAEDAWNNNGPFSPWSDCWYCRPYFMVDMAHIAGLIVAGDHPLPFGVADLITTTTHKTLRGPRGGMIFCRPELAKKVDSAVFPCCQGGPLQHVIAGKAVAAEEALTPEYKEYIHQVVRNASVMAEEFKKMGYDVVTGGTDNHLFLLDFTYTHPKITGKQVQDACDRHGITLNKNCVPGEQRSPVQTSGVRIGTPAMTTRGYKEEDFIQVAHMIDEVIKEIQNGTETA
jgi:glycine hydroxymethyltransferase